MYASTPVISWGLATCWSLDEYSAFNKCCYAGERVNQGDCWSSSKSCGICFEKNSPVQAAKARFEGQAYTSRLYITNSDSHKCLKGCTDSNWQTFFYLYRMWMLCNHCLDFHRFHKYLANSCIAGRIAAMFVWFASELAQTTDVVQKRRWATVILSGFASCRLKPQDWWLLTGMTDTHMRYIIAQHQSIPFHPYNVSSGAHDELFNWSVTCLDVGSAGLGDTLYFLAKQARVAAVDGAALPWFPWQNHSFWSEAVAAKRVWLQHAAITGGSDDVGESGYVKFYVDNQLPGINSLRKFSVTRPEHDALQEIQTRALSCVKLLQEAEAWGGPILYMKIDIEEADLECVEAIAQHQERVFFGKLKTPMFFSTEFPWWNLTQVVPLLQAFKTLGYHHYKLCRQRMFNLMVRDDGTGGRWAASGPFGDDALDMFLGTSWRSASSVIELIPRMEFENRKYATWFDLHVKA